MFLRVLRQAMVGRFRLPVHIILYVTYRCNSRCQTCFNWKKLNAGKTDMTLAEFEHISRSLGEILWLHISGGEPFLRDELPDICEIFSSNNRPAFISIPTSGLDPERVERISAEILRRIHSPIAIDLALDGIGSQHDEIRGVKGNFDKMTETYNRLIRLKKKFRNLSTKVTTVVSNKNFDHLEEVIDYVYHNMRGVSFHTIIFLRGNPRQDDVFLPSLEKLSEKRQVLLKTWERYGYDTNISWPNRIVANAAHRMLLDLYLKMMREKKNCVSCLAGLSHAVIGADGAVSFCELLESIGNLRNYNFNFQRLWQSSQAKVMRTFIKSGGCWCTQGCVHMDNLFLNMRMYPRLINYVGSYLSMRLVRNIQNRVREEKIKEFKGVI